jgi:hypothetical protein
VPSAANTTTKEEEGIIAIVKVKPTKNNAVVIIDKRGENDNSGFFFDPKISSCAYYNLHKNHPNTKEEYIHTFSQHNAVSVKGCHPYMMISKRLLLSAQMVVAVI